MRAKVTRVATDVSADRANLGCHCGKAQKNCGRSLPVLRSSVKQSFCLSNEILKRNVIECCEILHRSQSRTLLASLYHSDGSLAVACSCRDFNLLHLFAFPQRSEDLAKRLLKSGRNRFQQIGHTSIFGIDATACRHYSAFL